MRRRQIVVDVLNYLFLGVATGGAVIAVITDQPWYLTLGWGLALGFLAASLAMRYGAKRRVETWWRLRRYNKRANKQGLSLSRKPKQGENIATELLSHIEFTWEGPPVLFGVAQHNDHLDPIGGWPLPFGGTTLDLILKSLHEVKEETGRLPFELTEPLLGVGVMSHGFLSARPQGDATPPGENPADHQARFMVIATVGGGVVKGVMLRDYKAVGTLPDELSPLSDKETDILHELLRVANSTWEAP